MPVGLLQSFAADTFNLTAVKSEVSWRLLTGWAAERRSFAVEDYEEKGGHPPRVSGLPTEAKCRRIRCPYARDDKHLQR